MRLEVFTGNSSETKKTGELFARELLKQSKNNKAIVIGLEGDLGGGKTAFAQGLAKGLGIKEKIQSPTFVLMKKFKIAKGRFTSLYHFDCYRIKSFRELISLGFKSMALNPGNILVVEWADKVRRSLLKDSIRIKFEFVDKQKRKISFG